MLLSLLLICSLVLPGAQDGRSVEDLLRRIRIERDGVPEETLEELGLKQTPEALEALKIASGWLRDPERIAEVFAALRHFRTMPGLCQEAIEYLRQKAVHSTRAEVRIEAVKALPLFGPKGLAELELVLSESDDRFVRGAAIEPLLDRLIERGDAESLAMILDNVEPGVFGLGASLETMRQPGVFDVVLARLAHGGEPLYVKVLLLSWLKGNPEGDASEVLAELLTDRSMFVRLAAVDVMIARQEAGLAERSLNRLLDSRDRHMRLYAILGLAGGARDRAAIFKRVTTWARGSDQVARIGAAQALAVFDDEDDALTVLHGLLTDSSWRVRAAALASTAQMRRRASLPLLMERLGQERGRLFVDVVDALRRLTGLGFGLSKRRWEAWWEAEGDTFQLPEEDPGGSLWGGEDADLDSFATFYGLPVWSDRTAFVVDASGSMNESAETNESVSDIRGQTRLIVAKRQLVDLLERCPDGNRCNIVFFSDTVEGWRTKTVPLDSRWRERAFDFVARRHAEGATNVFDALEVVCKDDTVDTIYLLSDGDPNVGRHTDPTLIRRQIELWNRLNGLRIHCISVGEISVFLEGLARDTGGRYVEVGVPSLTYNNQAWDVVKQRHAAQSEYELALIWSKRASQLEPSNANYANTLGVALYRVGRLVEAQRTLERAGGLRSEYGGDRTLDLAFRAMCRARLGDSAEGWRLLRQARDLREPRPGSQAEGFLEEARRVLERASSEPEREN